MNYHQYKKAYNYAIIFFFIKRVFTYLQYLFINMFHVIRKLENYSLTTFRPGIN